MGVNCNLELRLLPPSAASAASFPDHRHQNNHEHHRALPMLDFLSIRNNTTSEEEKVERRQQQQQQQQQKQQQQRRELTIFYNGQLRVCDVTELQARAIIMHASREIREEKAKTELELGSCCKSQSPAISSPSTASTVASLSMKRSLQRFLQKRKHRIQSASPYSH